MYSQAFTEDVTRIKIMVYSVHAALTVQIIMLMNNLWRVYAAGFGDLGAFDLVSTTWFSVIVIESVGGSHNFYPARSARAYLTFVFLKWLSPYNVFMHGGYILSPKESSLPCS